MVPAGREVPVYIPPTCEREGQATIYVVEGPVKALSLQSHGFHAIALGGVATALDKDHSLNDSWKNIALVQRNVVVVFDANRANNPQVARAEARLVAALDDAGARVKIAALPLRDDGGDQGPDDYLAEHREEALGKVLAAAVPGDPVERVRTVHNKDEALVLLEDSPFLWSILVRGAVAQTRVADLLRPLGVKEALLRRAMKEAQQKKASGLSEARPKSNGSRYEERDGGLVRVWSPDGKSEVADPLCNFTAQIVEDRTLDDGSGEVAHVFVLDGALHDGSPFERISITPQAFIGDLWPTERWGSQVMVSADIPRAAHHLQNAIKQVSESVQTVAYAHTGFREESGNWFYLHTGGAIGAANITVELSGTAARFTLPETAEDVAQAVRTSLDFLRVAQPRITLPLHAAAYRAPLGEAQRCDTAIALVGPTGSLKSSIQAVAQSHFGDFQYNSLPLSWEATANSLEFELFRAKDVLVTIDDFVPRGELYDEMHKKGERVLRAIGNGSARGRLRSDLTSRPDRPCRALVVMTGEDHPRGESVQARIVIIQMTGGDVDRAKLSDLQARQHKLPHAMGAYVEWLRSRMTELKKEVPQKYLEFRNQLHLGGHLRAPSAIAHLLVGAFYFGEFTKEIGVMSDAEATMHVEKTREALLSNAQEQLRATQQSNPARRFMEILSGLFVRGKITLRAVGAKLARLNESGATEVGWKDSTHAYVVKDAILGIVNTELEGTREGQSLQPYSLCARLADQGFTECVGKDNTPKFDGAKDGTRVRVLKIRLDKLQLPPDPSDPDPDREPERYWPDPDEGVWLEPPAIRPQRPLRCLLPANDVLAQMPRSCPDVSGELGDAEEARKATSNSIVMETSEDEAKASAQMPRCMGERLSLETESASRESARSYAPGAPLSPQETWASGQLGGADPFLHAVRMAGHVGVAAAVDAGRDFLSVAVPGGPAQVFDLSANLGFLSITLGQVTLVGHDLRPTVAALQSHGVQPVEVFDTMVAWKLYDGGRHDDENFFSFTNARKTLFGRDIAAPTGLRERLEQEARDALIFERDLRLLLKGDALQDVAELEFALLPVVTEMQATGVAIDPVKWQGLVDEWSQEAFDLRKILTRTLAVKNVDDNAQVLVALQRRGLPVTHTSGEALASYADMPVVAQLLLYRRRSSFVASTGKAVLDALKRSPDGRVRTTMHQLGARTGRMSCSEPNLMGLPRDERVRACIVAPPGKTLIIGDYKAIEMRVIADQTGDERLRQVFATPGRCPHKHTAAVLLPGKSEELVTDEEKNQSKPINFGLCFGMSAPTMVTYARKNFHVVFTEPQAAAFKSQFLEHYKGIADWHARTAQEKPAELRTRSGRVSYYLHSDEGYNARLSFPVQGTAADGMKAAIVLLQPKLKPLGARFVLTVHDELVVEAPEEHAEGVLDLMREVMIAGMKKYVPTVPIEVDLRVASSWAKTGKKS
jgi:DNA polymerase-1